jgi:hypothetical protein
MNEAPAWFHNAVVEGVQMLRTLSLPSTPPAETITLTTQVWIQVLWAAKRGWVEAHDLPRLKAAFMALAAELDRWPTPKAVLASLPARPDLKKLPPPRLTPEQIAANKRRLREALGQLAAAKVTK